MDANKLKVLRSIGYEITPCCGLCKHGVFLYAANDFGTCELETYEHEKHTGPARQLSVNKYGRCLISNHFEFDPMRIDATWAQFVKENK